MTFQIFQGNKSNISRFFPGMNLKFPDFFREWISNFQIFHSRCQISRFYGKWHWISRNFTRINLKFPDLMKTDPEFPDFFWEWISNFQFFSRNESQISRFFIVGDVKFPDCMGTDTEFPGISREYISNFQIAWKQTLNFQIFSGNDFQISRFFPGMNLKFPDFSGNESQISRFSIGDVKFPDFMGTDTEFPGISQE